MLPHFNRLTWEQIYAGWRSPRYQYYWRDLPLRTVSFDRSHYPPKEEASPPQPEGRSGR
jgi:hypothetical protein